MIPPVRLDPWQDIVAVSWGRPPDLLVMRFAYIASPAGYYGPESQMLSPRSGPVLTGNIAQTYGRSADLDPEVGGPDAIFYGGVIWPQSEFAWGDAVLATVIYDLRAIRENYPGQRQAKIRLFSASDELLSSGLWPASIEVGLYAGAEIAWSDASGPGIGNVTITGDEWRSVRIIGRQMSLGGYLVPEAMITVGLSTGLLKFR